MRQLLTESVLLAIAGAIVGTALAYGALRVILTLVPPNTIPDESEVAVNLPVLLFTLMVSAATSLIFGLAPALHTCARDLTNPLRTQRPEHDRRRRLRLCFARVWWSAPLRCRSC